MKIQTQKSTSSISIIVSLSLVLFIIGTIILLLINANNVSNKIKESIAFTITLKNADKNGLDFNENQGLSDEEESIKEEIEKKRRFEFEIYLKSSEYFKEITFIDKKAATKKLIEDLGEDFENILGFSPLNHSFDAKVNAQFVNIDNLSEIEEYITSYQGSNIVKDIYYQKNLVHQINQNVQKVSVFLLIICIIFCLISFALINNTIRIAIYSKRLIIKTMRLVGATNIFIQKPYLIKSVYQGIISSILAIFGLIGILELLKNKVPDFINTKDFIEIGIIFIVILIFGTTMSFISTFFSVRKYLNLNEDKFYN